MQALKTLAIMTLARTMVFVYKHLKTDMDTSVTAVELDFMENVAKNVCLNQDFQPPC